MSGRTLRIIWLSIPLAKSMCLEPTTSAAPTPKLERTSKTLSLLATWKIFSGKKLWRNRLQILSLETAQPLRRSQAAPLAPVKDWLTPLKKLRRAWSNLRNPKTKLRRRSKSKRKLSHLKLLLIKHLLTKSCSILLLSNSKCLRDKVYHPSRSKCFTPASLQVNAVSKKKNSSK